MGEDLSCGSNTWVILRQFLAWVNQELRALSNYRKVGKVGEKSQSTPIYLEIKRIFRPSTLSFYSLVSGPLEGT